jgi:hypothetical protein
LWPFVIFCGHLLYFVAICYILWPFVIFCGHLLYIFLTLVYCIKTNLATLVTGGFYYQSAESTSHLVLLTRLKSRLKPWRPTDEWNLLVQTVVHLMTSRVARCYIYCRTKNPNLGKFWRALEWKILVYFMVIRNILRPFGTFNGHLVIRVTICYIFLSFGRFIVSRKIWRPWRPDLANFRRFWAILGDFTLQ